METGSPVEVLCVMCARLSKSCCSGREIYVTRGDVLRISAFSGRDDFTEWQSPMNPDYSGQNDDPIWDAHVFRDDGTRRILKRSVPGECTFLNPGGCQLPEDVRPLVCRLHPYTYTSTGIDTAPSPDCPVHLLPPNATVFESLKMPLDKALSWHRALYDEILLEKIVSDEIS